LTLLSPERGEPENALTAFIADEALMCRCPVADALPFARIPTFTGQWCRRNVFPAAGEHSIYYVMLTISLRRDHSTIANNDYIDIFNCGYRAQRAPIA